MFIDSDALETSRPVGHRTATFREAENKTFEYCDVDHILFAAIKLKGDDHSIRQKRVSLAASSYVCGHTLNIGFIRRKCCQYVMKTGFAMILKGHQCATKADECPSLNATIQKIQRPRGSFGINGISVPLIPQLGMHYWYVASGPRLPWTSGSHFAT